MLNHQKEDETQGYLGTLKMKKENMTGRKRIQLSQKYLIRVLLPLSRLEAVTDCILSLPLMTIQSWPKSMDTDLPLNDYPFIIT
jgi:hypothetical protein